MKRARKPMEQQKPPVPEKRSPGEEPLGTVITVEELLMLWELAIDADNATKWVN